MDVGSKRKAEVLSFGGDRGEREKDKLCMVYYCGPGYGEDEYHVYIVDLDASDAEEDFTFKAPTLILERKRSLLPDVFCLLDSTLYFICCGDPDRTGEITKCVYIYEFPPDISEISGKILGMADIRKIGEMHYTKFRPIAVRTPDMKNILVFSSFFYHRRNRVPIDTCHFEIYDSCRRQWYPLPPMPADWRSVTFIIKAHFFINDHTILLQTDNVGNIILDFGSPNAPCPGQRWHRLDGWSDVQTSIPLKVPAILCDFTIFIKDDLYLTSRLAYRKSKAYIETKAFSYPYRSSLIPYGQILWTDRIALVNSDACNGVWKFCITRTEVDSGGCCPHIMTANRRATCPHLIVNVYGFNLEEYKKDKLQGELLPGVTTEKSFKFYLKNTAYPDDILPACVLPFKQKNQSSWT